MYCIKCKQNWALPTMIEDEWQLEFCSELCRDRLSSEKTLPPLPPLEPYTPARKPPAQRPHTDGESRKAVSSMVARLVDALKQLHPQRCSWKQLKEAAGLQNNMSTRLNRHLRSKLYRHRNAHFALFARVEDEIGFAPSDRPRLYHRRDMRLWVQSAGTNGRSLKEAQSMYPSASLDVDRLTESGEIHSGLLADRIYGSSH